VSLIRDRLSNVPFVSDLWDARARVQGSMLSGIDAAKIVGSTLVASVTGLTDGLSKLFAGVPVAVSVMTAVLPSLLVAAGAACIISSRSVLSSRLLNGTGDTQAPMYTYVYGRGLRTASKLVVFPLILLAGYQVPAQLPNRVLGRATLGGFICDQDGMPVDEGEVVVMDRFNEPVGAHPSRLDSVGFFYSPLRPWGLRPEHIRIELRQCDLTVSVHDSEPAGPYGCRANPYGGTLPRGTWGTWRVHCSARSSDQ